VLLPLLAGVALIIAVFFVAESRRGYTRELAEIIQVRLYRMRELAELIYVCLEAESAQRGYLLTREAQYAEPYDRGRIAATQLAAQLRGASRAAGRAEHRGPAYSTRIGPAGRGACG